VLSKIVFSRSFLSRFATMGWGGFANPTIGWKIGLFKNVISLDWDRVNSDFTRPLWTGYADQFGLFSITPGPNGVFVAKMVTLHFTTGTPSGPQVVRGIIAQFGIPGFAAGFFAHLDSDIVVSSAGQDIPIDITINLESVYKGP
jgi:hypothetical protein